MSEETRKQIEELEAKNRAIQMTILELMAIQLQNGEKIIKLLEAEKG